MKKQIVIIHGGYALDTRENFLTYLKAKKVTIESFKATRDWKANIEPKLEKLGLANKFEIISPRMPNSQNSRYTEWKIWFEKLIPFLKNDVTLIGHSLGGLFLVKYLSENKFPKKIHAVLFVAAPYKGRNKKHTVNTNFILGKGLKELADLSKLSEQCKNLYFYHSKDDAVVPFSDLKKFKAIFPTAHFSIFNNRRHFNTDSFPELIDDLIESF